ncbi:16S rRNA (uracil(1498)-N(3))-methyltransferase [Actinomyces minihominis]|uniref:16S rRNA (uracil(1498)-N(3))-methyltransferase n=1 Tax=Actinomyces minihominis TaxID=2002838 RepID=UPI001F5C9714|nr:16S rRNA (uracil(1498)-N(3))-methyltransferase [Actinomyces minihominis]
MTRPVFITPLVQLVDSPEASAVPLAQVASPGAQLRLTGQEAHHARKVQRLRQGEELDLTDGQGTRVTSVVVAGREGDLDVRVTGVLTEDEPQPRLVLVQALAKGGRDEAAVESATEVGVDGVIPWAASRSIVRWEPRKAEAGVTRWQRIATAAAKQARRAWVPQVSQVQTTRQLAALVKELVEGGGIALICHESATSRYSAVIERLGSRLARAPQVAVLVGPEGGITDEELATLVEAGGTIIQLGDTVMRSSTAGTAALVALNVALGRW